MRVNLRDFYPPTLIHRCVTFSFSLFKGFSLFNFLSCPLGFIIDKGYFYIVLVSGFIFCLMESFLGFKYSQFSSYGSLYCMRDFFSFWWFIVNFVNHLGFSLLYGFSLRFNYGVMFWFKSLGFTHSIGFSKLASYILWFNILNYDGQSKLRKHSSYQLYSYCPIMIGCWLKFDYLTDIRAECIA